ncbi:MAG: HAD family hydrolase [bacterium]
MQKIDLLIFDLDGTLVDTRQDLTNSVNYARDSLGLPPLELTQVMQYVGNGVRKLMERSLPQPLKETTDDAITHFRNHYREHLLDCSTLYPGVEEVLHHFHQKKMVVISNKPEEFCRTILEGVQIVSYFDLILGGDTLSFLKPSPEPILHVLKQLKIRSEKTVIIGDGTTDIEAGLKAKVLTCAVTYGFRAKEILLQAQPDYVVQEIQELKRLFN